MDRWHWILLGLVLVQLPFFFLLALGFMVADHTW